MEQTDESVMTPREWMKSEFEKMKLTLPMACEILGLSPNYLGNKQDMDIWEAMTILTDVNRSVRGMKPIGAYASHRKRKRCKRATESKKRRIREQKRAIAAGGYFETDDIWGGWE